ncbi:MAG: PLP-dependent aminotransferase family protein [Alphaproteobacteria bacterium]|nr:PLP-dependent aminotransferase family protein [Alphaproteobacteria bacterium]
MNWQPDISDRRGPRYRVIADRIADDIQDGRLSPGDRMPTHRELARQLGVTVGTITRAYAEAERRGLIAGHVGRGTFVNPLRETAKSADGTPARRTAGSVALAIQPTSDAAEEAGPAPISAAHLPTAAVPAPDPSAPIDLSKLVPARGAQAIVVSAALAAVAGSVMAVGGYTNGKGREAYGKASSLIREFLKENLQTEFSAQSVFTNSGRAAIYGVLAALVGPNEIVLTDTATYDGLRPIADLLGLRIEPVAGDRDGMLPESLELACWSSKANFLFLMPTLHNPTGIIMPEGRRQAIAELADKYKLSVIEDEVCGLLAGSSRPTPFVTRIPERTVLITSFSKSLSAELGLGVVTGPAALTHRLKSIVDTIGAAPLASHVAAASRLIESGEMGDLLSWQREEIKARHAIAREELSGLDVWGAPLSPHLWLELPAPWRVRDFERELSRRNVIVGGPEAFTPERAAMPHAVRIVLTAAVNQEILRTGLEKIASCFRPMMQRGTAAAN